MKFSIPNVKKGTVIEYKFKRSFNYASLLDPWVIQRNIPVKYSKYESRIPEYFIFRHEVKGYEAVERESSTSNEVINTYYNGRLYNEDVVYENLLFTAHDIPAIKDDSYIWSIDDYRSLVEFELTGVAFPGQLYKNYSTSWTAVNKLLEDHNEFGRKLKIRNPLKEQTQQLVLDSLSIYDKAVAVFSLLKEHIKWNDKFSLWCGMPNFVWITS